MGYEKNMNFLVVPKSQKVWKKVERHVWAPSNISILITKDSYIKQRGYKRRNLIYQHESSLCDNCMKFDSQF